jgi:hypothetical protein
LGRPSIRTGSKASIAWLLPLSQRYAPNCGGERTAPILDTPMDQP